MDNDLYCSCNEFPNLIALLTMPFLTAYSHLYKYVSHLFFVLVYFPCVIMLPFHLRRIRQASAQPVQAETPKMMYVMIEQMR